MVLPELLNAEELLTLGADGTVIISLYDILFVIVRRIVHLNLLCRIAAIFILQLFWPNYLTLFLFVLILVSFVVIFGQTLNILLLQTLY